MKDNTAFVAYIGILASVACFYLYLEKQPDPSCQNCRMKDSLYLECNTKIKNDTNGRCIGAGRSNKQLVVWLALMQCYQ